jgi:hypothetical protein
MSGYEQGQLIFVIGVALVVAAIVFMAVVAIRSYVRDRGKRLSDTDKK